MMSKIVSLIPVVFNFASYGVPHKCGENYLFVMETLYLLYIPWKY